ncbi:sporulation integral membrane protein YtvI [Candidatus Pseudoscillospira sp. SGI.172]|uniref:sporulation integral membrane protein YtvI n=1 Tax=Candidatus Pseudoscillospira sp. SGI.172 TaxID=3420582 RepID=UPI002A78DF68|nr:sporulation integral membrane protein YtvI [Pseudoflavonifractor sp.]MDY3019979.1 sporulation integral membrane protein YtvI [Oscillospiraceae bacterium]
MKELSWHDRGRLWLRLGVRLALTLLGLWAIARLGPPLISLFAPFLLAAVMAWMLSPVVKWLNRRLRLPRKALSLALLLLVFAALGAGLWALLAGIGREIITLAGNWESLVASLQATSEAVGNLFSRGMALLPAAAQATVDGLVSQFFTWLETVIPRILSTAVDSLTAVAKGLPSFTVATVVFIIASYFITADYPRLRSGLADRLPNGPRAFLGQVKRAASAGFGGYVKAQVILSIGVFFILVGGFLLIRQPYALLLALGLAVLDFIPILGAGTVMVPWAVVDLFTGNPRGALGLMVVWGLVALFRRVAEPKVLGDQTGLSPILSLVSVYVGMQVGGVAGMILGPVLCLVVINVCRSGVLDNTLRDVKLAAADLSAILKSGKPEESETEFSDRD